MTSESLDISCTNDLQELAFVAERIDEFCEAHDIGSEIAFAVNLSIDELLTNTISYGYADDEPHQIDISVRLDSSDMIIEIADDGLPFELSSVAKPNTDADLEDRPVGGLGVFLVYEMMDSVEYRRNEDRNVVTLIKKAANARIAGT